MSPKTKHYEIIPSLLSANPLALGHDIEALIQAGISTVHLDIMDQHYVPNLTYGPAVCRAIHEQFSTLRLDVHLMTQPVDELITAFANAGATRISIHPDATTHLDRSLHLIRATGCEAGLVLNPSTSPEVLTWCAQRLDFVMIMTVNPGFGGQTLIQEQINKIKKVHTQYPHLPICVDGGVTIEHLPSLALVGCTQFVAGSAIFQSTPVANTIEHMYHTLNHVPIV